MNTSSDNEVDILLIFDGDAKDHNLECHPVDDI
ncbi:hypothetical protein BH23THE1_BH23THE1_22840 [soil metagenome]